MIPYYGVGGTYCAMAGRLREVLSSSPYCAVAGRLRGVPSLSPYAGWPVT
ncbi:hypothetical protein [Kribbella sp. NPDC006257]